MFAHSTSLHQVEITSGHIVFEIGVYTQETEQLHHEYKMEIGIAVLKIVEQGERPVEECKKGIITSILAQGMCEQFGKIKCNR